MHLSPHLGTVRLDRRSDLKIEIERLTVQDTIKAGSVLAGVVEKAHARQMDEGTRKARFKELERNRTSTPEAPSSVVSLIGSYEVAYLEHCRIPHAGAGPVARALAGTS